MGMSATMLSFWARVSSVCSADSDAHPAPATTSAAAAAQRILEMSMPHFCRFPGAGAMFFA